MLLVSESDAPRPSIDKEIAHSLLDLSKGSEPKKGKGAISLETRRLLRQHSAHAAEEKEKEKEKEKREDKDENKDDPDGKGDGKDRIVNTTTTYYIRVPTAQGRQGKQGKWPKRFPVRENTEFVNFVKTQGKHRKFCLNTGRTQGILVVQVVNVLILKVKDIGIIAEKNPFMCM